MIRNAVDEDLVALQSVFRRASWANEGDRPLLSAHPEFLEWPGDAIGQGRTRIALVGTRIVGFTSICASGEAIELEDLFVDPDWMRHGVGRALVEDVVEFARVARARRIEVDANDHALRFYERVGFSSERRVALGHGTATRMARTV